MVLIFTRGTDGRVARDDEFVVARCMVDNNGFVKVDLERLRTL